MFRVHNGGADLKECRFGLDREFWAGFGGLEVYRGFFGGNQLRGRPDLRQGEAVTFKFHHDNNNNLLLQGPDESWYPRELLPKQVTVVCDDQEVTWRARR